MKLTTRLLAVAVIAVFLAGCNKKSNDHSEARFKSMTLTQKAQYLLNSNDTDASHNNDFDPVLYKQVMTELENKTDSQSEQLKAQLYLKHGVWSIDFGVMHGAKNMRVAVTQSLEDFIHTLQIDPNNQAAKQQIKQILDVYKTMPDKSVPQKVVPQLKKLGFMK